MTSTRRQFWTTILVILGTLAIGVDWIVWGLDPFTVWALYAAFLIPNVMYAALKYRDACAETAFIAGMESQRLTEWMKPSPDEPSLSVGSSVDKPEQCPQCLCKTSGYNTATGELFCSCGHTW